MLETLKELAFLFRGIRHFARRRTLDTRKWFHSYLRLLQWRKYRLRRNMAQSMFAQQGRLTIRHEEGFLVTRDLDPGIIADVQREARAILGSVDLTRIHGTPDSPQFSYIPIHERLSLDHPFVRLALHRDVVGMLSRYFEMVPVIVNLNLIYSPNRANFTGTAQGYHLDGQDIRSVQFFTYIEDVDDECGPVTVIRADASERAARALRYRKTPSTKRVPDDQMYAIVNADREVSVLKGPAGTCVFWDGDRCFHYGSRQGSRPRLVLAVDYCSPFAFTLPHNWSKGLPFAGWADRPGLDELDRLVLGQR